MPIYSEEEERRLSGAYPGMMNRPGENAIPSSLTQIEDNKNRTMAAGIMGAGTRESPYWGTPLERFSPAGEIPRGVSVPGVPRGALTEAIPKTYDVAEEELMTRLKAPAPSIPGNLPGSEMLGGIHGRLSQITGRLSGSLRKSTRANLIAEAGQLLGFVQTMAGYESQRGMKGAELAEAYTGRAIPGMAALGAMRGARMGEAKEEAMLPWEIMSKQAGIGKDIAGIGYYGAEEAETRKRTAALPPTGEEAVARAREIGAPYAPIEKPTRAIEFYSILSKRESEKAISALGLGKGYTPTDEMTLWKKAKQMAKPKEVPTFEKFKETAKEKGSKLSDVDLKQYYEENYGE